MPFDHASLCVELPMLRRLATIWAKQDAEDLVQATAEKALRSAEQFKGGNLQAWLVTIMRSVHLDQAKSHYNRYTTTVTELPEQTQPPAQESAIALHQAITKLGADSWLVASAYGYSGDEIAAHYNVTRQHVQKHIYNERQALFKKE